MDEVWPEAQAHVARELGYGNAGRSRLCTQYARAACAAVRRRVVGPADTRAHERWRISQCPSAARALGGSRRSGRRTHPGGTVRHFHRAVSRRRRSRAGITSCSSARCCSAAGRRSTAWRNSLPSGLRRDRGSSSTAITPSWRSSGRSAKAPRSRVLPRRRLQIRDGRRGLRVHACADRASVFGRRSPAGSLNSRT